jgi:hypothetical protein
MAKVGVDPSSANRVSTLVTIGEDLDKLGVDESPGALPIKGTRFATFNRESMDESFVKVLNETENNLLSGMVT